jgi:hypothetical protein
MTTTTQTRDGYTFTKRTGNRSLTWTVAPAEDPATRLGTVRPNGSRLRERSWTWTATDGTEGKSATRRNAADALLAHAAKPIPLPVNPRSIRIPDALWHDARKATAANGTTISDVVRDALAAYVLAHDGDDHAADLVARHHERTNTR